MDAASFEIRRGELSEQPVIHRLLELYQHDLSDVWDQDLDVNGEYGYALDAYWSDPNSIPYLIIVDSKYAGLALVNDQVKVGDGDHWLEQFFIVKKYRRRGLGNAAATRLFDGHPGRWQVGQMPLNFAAQAFWRSVISKYSGADYNEHRLTTGPWVGVLQDFKSRTA